jgi:integrase
VGVTAKVVSELLGHSSVTVTRDLYSHVMPAVEGEHAVAKLIGRNRRKPL